MRTAMTNYKLIEISADVFGEFNKELAIGSFLQTAEMGKLMESNGWSITFLAVESDHLHLTALLAAKPMTGGNHFEIQFGPSLKENDSEAELFLYQAVQDYVKNHNGLELLVIPNVNYQIYNDKGEALGQANDSFISELEKLGYAHSPIETGYNKRGESTWHYVKDLSELENEKQLLKSYSKDGQYSVKKTVQFGIKVRPLAYEELNKFKEITSETSERRGFNDHDLAYYQKMYQSFGDKLEFLIAEINFKDYQASLQNQIENLEEKIARSQSPRKEKQRLELEDQLKMQNIRLVEAGELLEEHGSSDIILAGSLFVYGVTESIYLFSGSHEAFKKLYAPFAIQHEVMKKSIELKIPSYNFFGVQGVFDGTDGVLHFKQNFRGEVVAKVGYFTYLPRPAKYKLIQMVKKLLGRK